jgi:hypothetical protein
MIHAESPGVAFGFPAIFVGKNSPIASSSRTSSVVHASKRTPRFSYFGRFGNGNRGSGGGGGGGGGDRGDNDGSGDASRVTLAAVPFANSLALSSADASGIGVATLGWAATSLLRGAGSRSIKVDGNVAQGAFLSGLFGFLGVGGLGTFWYTLIEDVFPGADAVPVAIKTALDVLLYIPFLSVVQDQYHSTLRNQGLNANNRAATSLLRNRLIWLPAQAISFAMFPVWQRVAWMTGVVFFLSLIAKVTGRKIPDDDRLLS